MSHLPAIVAARGSLVFPQFQDRRKLESFFRELCLSLFDSCAIRGKLVGHLKLYGESGGSTTIRANATGMRESIQVETKNFKPVREMKIWVNLIVYARSEDDLREKLLRTLSQFENGRRATFRGMRVADSHRYH